MSKPAKPPQARVSYRRTLHQRGYVNFPTSDPRYTNTGEGGMFVWLVVVDGDWDRRWPLCCNGSGASLLYSEVFVGHDLRGVPDTRLPGSVEEDDNTLRSWKEICKIGHPSPVSRHVDYHFPDAKWQPTAHGWNVKTGKQEPMNGRPDLAKERGPLVYSESIEYLAAILLGTTGWSGARRKFDCRRPAYWTCTRRDLNPDGQRLYELVKRLYGGSGRRVILMTWLDT